MHNRQDNFRPNKPFVCGRGTNILKHFLTKVLAISGNSKDFSFFQQKNTIKTIFDELKPHAKFYNPRTERERKEPIREMPTLKMKATDSNPESVKKTTMEQATARTTDKAGESQAR